MRLIVFFSFVLFSFASCASSVNKNGEDSGLGGSHFKKLQGGKNNFRGYRSKNGGGEGGVDG